MKRQKALPHFSEKIKAPLYNLRFFRGLFAYSSEKKIKKFSVPVLRGLVLRPGLLILPFRQTAVIEMLLAVLDDKRNDVMSQAFLQSDQPSHTPVSVLEWVDVLKLRMQSDHVIYRGRFL